MSLETVTHRIPQQRSIRTPLPGPNSQELGARRRAAVADGLSSSHGSYLVDLDGGIAVDADGNAFIDLASGIAVTSVGASDAAVVAAVQEQVAHFTHTAMTISPYESYVHVCELLNELTPGDHDKRSILVSTGAEAVENAVKIARHATGRQGIIVLDHAYHGRTNLTMAMTAKNMPYKDGFGPFASEVYRVPGSYPYRDGLTGAEAAAVTIDWIHRTVGEARVAAVVIEPEQGEGGFIVPADGYLETLTAWMREHGILFVADEIQSGFCRTGTWFASEHWGVVPDLITTAKGIAGGMPLAGVTGRAELMNSVHGGGLGGTYAGNPVACAAAVAAIGRMSDLDLPAAARRIGVVVREVLEDAATRLPAIGEVRGLGAMQAFELVRPGTTEPDAALAGAVVRRAYEQGVIALTCGSYGNVVRLLPSLVIGEDLLREALDVLVDAVADLSH